MYVSIMSNNKKMHRQTIRIHPKIKQRLFDLLKTGEYVNESDLIRRALNIGLNELEVEQYGTERDRRK